MSILTPDEVQECMTTAREVMGEGRDLEGCFAAEIEAALLKKLSKESAAVTEKVQEDYLREKQSLLDQRENWRCLAAKFEQERDELKAQLQELNLQYVSDFGQLQEKVEGLFSEYDMQNSSFAADARCIFEKSTT